MIAQQTLAAMESNQSNEGPRIDYSHVRSLPKESMQKPKKTQVVRRRKTTIDTESSTVNDTHPVPPSSDNPKAAPAVQQTTTFSYENEYIVQSIKAATNEQRAINNNRAEYERTLKNRIKDHDTFQQQNILNKMSFTHPIPIIDNVSIKVEFPLHVFPIEYQALIRDRSEDLNVRIEPAATLLLASTIIATRGKFKIEVRKNHLEPFTEYFIVVMPSGEKKSPLLESYKYGFDNIVEALQAEYEKNVPNKRRLEKMYKKLERKLLNDLMKGVDLETISDINLGMKEVDDALAPLKEKLNELPSRPMIFNDFPTMKKLAQNMQAQLEFLAIFDAEAGLWKSRVNGHDDTILLKGYTMEYFGNETATNGSVTMTSPCLTICSLIQPGVAFNLYSKEDLKDDGLLPRILPLFCLSKPRIQGSKPRHPNSELTELYETKINWIFKYCWASNANGNNRTIEILNMTDNAYAAYVKYSDMVNLQSDEGRFKHCKAFANKLAGHAVRLAGAIHFLKHDTPWEEPIDSSAMMAGIELAEFYAEHAIFAFDKRQNDSVVYARKILKWVKRQHKTTFGQREAQRGVGHCKINQIEAGIDLLLKNNYLAQHLNYKGNVVYIVNPNTFREED